MKTRPTSDRVRESLFDIIGARIEGSSFLDVYAGTGAIGIEAASRGAARVAFIEVDREALAALRKNLAVMEIDARVMPIDARKALSRLAGEGERFDFLFFDPPYAEAKSALETACRSAHDGLIGPGGVFILERARRDPLGEIPAGIELFDERRYGDTSISFFRISINHQEAPL